MDLDAFIDNAVVLAKKPKPRKKAAKSDKPTEFEQTRAMLNEMKLAQCKPISIHLIRTVQTCSCCQRQTEHLNSRILVKKSSRHITHFEQAPEDWRESLEGLPRVLESYREDTQSCVNCFGSTEEVNYD